MCLGETFQPGPRGGAAQNIECTDCGERFNVAIVGNHVLFAQYIGDRETGSDWSQYYAALPPRRLFGEVM